MHIAKKKRCERGLTPRGEYGIIRLYSQTRQAKVAQLVEHSTENAGVVGSIPSLGIFAAQDIEQKGPEPL